MLLAATAFDAARRPRKLLHQLTTEQLGERAAEQLGERAANTISPGARRFTVI